MSGFRRAAKPLGAVLAVLVAVAPALSPARADAPGRVVSLNLCTDQLAMMIAAPGQLVSVSWHAARLSVPDLAAQAQGIHANHGLAEEIYLLRPDLVLTGPYTAMTTVAMLDRLGIAVERFALTGSFDGIVADMRRMGQVLGRQDRAEALIAQFQADRAALAARVAGRPAPRVAVYSARGWTSGARSLENEILAAAGLRNIADDLGLGWGGFVPLEALLLTDPDRLVMGREDGGDGRDGHSEARALLAHPALRGSRAFRAGVLANDRGWVCGTPHALRAAMALAETVDR